MVLFFIIISVNVIFQHKFIKWCLYSESTLIMLCRISKICVKAKCKSISQSLMIFPIQGQKDVSLYSKVNWKSYCTHFFYCPAQLSWVDFTALYRPLRCCVTLSLLSLYEPKWCGMKTFGEIDEKPLKNDANKCEFEQTIPRLFFYYILFVIKMQTYRKNTFQKIL